MHRPMITAPFPNHCFPRSPRRRPPFFFSLFCKYPERLAFGEAGVEICSPTSSPCLAASRITLLCAANLGISASGLPHIAKHETWFSDISIWRQPRCYPVDLMGPGGSERRGNWGLAPRTLSCTRFLATCADPGRKRTHLHPTCH